ncbi:hypothetical protein C3L33_18036, partial [Rhododendron williamsianum]
MNITQSCEGYKGVVRGTLRLISGIFLIVILSNYYDLPFNDILDWRKFSVILEENDVYRLKQILKDISNSEFVVLHENLVKVQKHFQLNSPPVKYDAFHMVMYDLWLRNHVIKY